MRRRAAPEQGGEPRDRAARPPLGLQDQPAAGGLQEMQQQGEQTDDDALNLETDVLPAPLRLPASGPQDASTRQIEEDAALAEAMTRSAHDGPAAAENEELRRVIEESKHHVSGPEPEERGDPSARSTTLADDRANYEPEAQPQVPPPSTPTVRVPGTPGIAQGSLTPWPAPSTPGRGLGPIPGTPGRGPDQQQRVRRVLRDEGAQTENTGQLDWRWFDVNKALRNLHSPSAKVRLLTLRRLHVRWHHATSTQMESILRQAGASSEVLSEIHPVIDACHVCREWTRPGHREKHSFRTVSGFNEEIQVDLVFFHSRFSARDDPIVPIINIIDVATRYNQAVILRTKTEEELLASLTRLWIMPFGPPTCIVIDEEAGLSSLGASEWAEFMNTQFSYKAPRQHAWIAERHNALIRDSLHRIETQCDHEGRRPSLETVLGLVINLKNNLTLYNGFSPQMAVTGRTTAMLPSTLGSAGDHASAQHHQRLREMAVIAITEAHSQDRLARAGRHQTTPTLTPASYTPGALVDIWYDPIHKDSSGWRGPAEVQVVQDSHGVITVKWQGKILNRRLAETRPHLTYAVLDLPLWPLGEAWHTLRSILITLPAPGMFTVGMHEENGKWRATPQSLSAVGRVLVAVGEIVSTSLGVTSPYMLRWVRGQPTSPYVQEYSECEVWLWHQASKEVQRQCWLDTQAVRKLDLKPPELPALMLRSWSTSLVQGLNLPEEEWRQVHVLQWWHSPSTSARGRTATSLSTPSTSSTPMTTSPEQPPPPQAPLSVPLPSSTDTTAPAVPPLTSVQRASPPHSRSRSRSYSKSHSDAEMELHEDDRDPPPDPDLRGVPQQRAGHRSSSAPHPLRSRSRSQEWVEPSDRGGRPPPDPPRPRDIDPQDIMDVLDLPLSDTGGMEDEGSMPSRTVEERSRSRSHSRGSHDRHSSVAPTQHYPETIPPHHSSSPASTRSYPEGSIDQPLLPLQAHDSDDDDDELPPQGAAAASSATTSAEKRGSPKKEDADESPPKKSRREDDELFWFDYDLSRPLPCWLGVQSARTTQSAILARSSRYIQYQQDIKSTSPDGSVGCVTGSSHPSASLSQEKVVCAYTTVGTTRAIVLPPPSLAYDI